MKNKFSTFILVQIIMLTLIPFTFAQEENQNSIETTINPDEINYDKLNISKLKVTLADELNDKKSSRLLR